MHSGPFNRKGGSSPRRLKLIRKRTASQQNSIRELYQNINGLSATPREQIDTSDAANSDIALWPVHDKTRQKLVQRGKVQNIVVALTSPEDLAAAHIRFITKIAKAKRMTLQVGRRDDGLPNQAERNEEPPD